MPAGQLDNQPHPVLASCPQVIEIKNINNQLILSCKEDQKLLPNKPNSEKRIYKALISYQHVKQIFLLTLTTSCMDKVNR